MKEEESVTYHKIAQIPTKKMSTRSSPVIAGRPDAYSQLLPIPCFPTTKFKSKNVFL